MKIKFKHEWGFWNIAKGQHWLWLFLGPVTIAIRHSAGGYL